MTPKEKVTSFIKRNYETEKSKWACGMANNYIAWSEILEIWKSKAEIKSDDSDEIALLKKYLKECKRMDDYNEWRRKQ